MNTWPGYWKTLVYNLLSNILMIQERIVSGLLGNISATSKERSAIIWRNFGSSTTWKAWRLTHIHIVKSRRNFARSTTCFLLTGLSISLTIATRLTVSRVGLIGFRFGSLMILCSLRRWVPMCVEDWVERVCLWFCFEHASQFHRERDLPCICRNK